MTLAAAAWWWCGVARRYSPLRRRLFCGGCSWVEYQRIKLVLAWPWWLCPVVSTVSALSGVGVGNACGVRLLGVVFGALLGPEATGPATMSCRARSGAPFLWGVLGFLVFLSLPSAWCSSFWGVLCGVWGLGLLFENYIVDASILRHAPVFGRVCVDSNFFEGPWPFVGRGSLELSFLICVVKFLRAHGGCLGIRSR